MNNITEEQLIRHVRLTGQLAEIVRDHTRRLTLAEARERDLIDRVTALEAKLTR